ncbi:MAG: hypothetical protein RL095_58 [Verrucomicrobiota bacterium]|jgi:1-acyl-sn-glycerol-3-phosphate acyltransferase
MEPFKYQPAQDHGLDLAQAASSPLREAGLVSHLLAAMTGTALKLYLKLWHRLELSGLEHLPEDRPLILIANHCSHLDALCLLAALPPRWRCRASPLAAGDVFFPRPLRGIFSSLLLNAFPVWRGRACNEHWQILRRRLHQDRRIYILFPEGTRSPDGTLGEFKSGWARLVCGVEEGPAAMILPASISGAFEAWPRTASWPRPGKIRLSFGPAIDLGSLADERASWDGLAEQARLAVGRLQV